MEVTSIITAERSEEHGAISRYGVEEFVSDNVIVLRNALQEEVRRRTVEILKFRGTSHQKGEWPFTIVPGQGVIVLPLSALELKQKSSDMRISSGNPELDQMCGGGFFRDSIILVSGPTGPGKGSEFVVRLPAAAGPVEPVDAPQSAARPSGARSVRVLIVGDNRDAAGLMALVLQTSGYDTRDVHDGPAALEAARAFRPDVVLLDVGLPGMDGYRVAEALRSQEGLEGLRIIAVSGYGEEQARRRSRASGCEHHLIKPVDIEALLELLAQPVTGPGEGSHEEHTGPSLFAGGGRYGKL
jgi:CheY-like chemotaxis protein